MPIRSKRDTAAVDPGGSFAFEITVRRRDGSPAAAVPISISAKPRGSAGLEATKLETNGSGRATIAGRAGAETAVVTITAAHGRERWQGTVYVTDVVVTPAAGVRLDRAEEALLRILFRDKQRVHVVHEIAGGLSGNRVLRVQPFDTRGALLTQVVKLGARDDMRAEGEKYELFRDRLTSAAPVAGSVADGTRGGIIYGDATAAGRLERVTSFGSYFANHDSEQVHAALCAVLGSGLRRVHGRYHVVTRTYGDLIGTFLPEHLVVTLDGGAASCGLYTPRHAPDVAGSATEIEPRDLELHRFPTNATRPGDAITLRGFRIGKMQDGDLNLEDEQQARYKIKVRYDARPNGSSRDLIASLDGFKTGDRVDAVARYITDRETRTRFAIHDCLERNGLVSTGKGYQFDGETYPDPLSLLAGVLGNTTDVACGTIHGDLHWDNVMLESPSNWWLIDYGLTRDDGPVLFDFVKLEVYLRRSELSRSSNLSPETMLAFERDLVDNPFGRLAAVDYGHAELDKAAAAIRTIRRLARRYMLEDHLGYLRLVFAYALALAKYYPTEDRWAAADGDEGRLTPLRKAARQTFFAFAPALAIGRVLAWQRLREKPANLSFAFRPMGTTIAPRAGTVVLDVGNRLEAGVVDHHHLTDAQPECATSLVWKRPGLVVDHIAGEDPDRVQWLVHEWPDFDCVASTYVAWLRAKLGFFPPGAEQLQRYAFAVDAGGAFLEHAPFPERTPYALFALHLHESDPMDTTAAADAKRMRCGFDVMDFFCRQEVIGEHALATNVVPHEHGFWNANVRGDRKVFDDIDLRLATPFDLDLTLEDRVVRTKGLVLRWPRSLFFKVWARKAGYPLLVVEWLQPDKPDHRIVVSVPPDYTNVLQGLGNALERQEAAKRRATGNQRPADEPRWPDVDNNDPWYDGRSPIHAYTIVDSPHAGTVLSIADVMETLSAGSWPDPDAEPIGAA